MSAAGVRRAVEASARTLGATTVVVRLPVAPAATTEEQIGLPAPEFRDVTVAPCVLRTGRNGERDGSREVLAGAATLERALGVTDSVAARETLRSAAFVQAGGVPMLLSAVQVYEVFGNGYLYRLTLREADAEVRA